MNIIVLIKQVPATSDIKIEQKTGTLIREGVPSIVNPDDLHALEEGLRLKEEFGGMVTAISMGPPQAIDGDTAQVGPQVAECLDIPQITYVRKAEIKGNKLVAERIVEDGYEKIECRLPALITVMKELNKPRYPTIERIIYACESADIKIWNAGDIGAMADRTGLKGSPTSVKSTFTPEHKRKGELLSGDRDSIARSLLEGLKGKKII